MLARVLPIVLPIVLPSVLPTVCSIQSLERLASVEVLPLLNTDPVVNIVIC